MSKKRVSKLSKREDVNHEFVKERIDRLMDVTEGRWLARRIGCSPASVYQWRKDKPRSLPSVVAIWKIASIEAVLFELEQQDNFKEWLKACGYNYDDPSLKAYFNWVKLQGQTITITFPGIKVEW